MHDSRMRIWFALFVLAVFCLGLTAGVMIGRQMLSPSGAPAFGRGPGPGPGRGAGGPPPEVLLERLTRDLDLDESQRSQVSQALRESRNRVERFRRDVRDRFDEEQRALRAEIRKVLTPEQQPRFDRWVEGDRARRGGPGRGRGPR
jgi:Spy/CpxP family protein refolding chaperone